MGNGHVLAQWDFLMHNGKPQLFRLLYGINMFFFAIDTDYTLCRCNNAGT